MLAFTLRKKQSRPAARPESAGQRLDLGVVERRPRVQKSAFGFIFATTKQAQEITGIEDVPRERRQHLFRYGAWHDLDFTEPALKKWLTEWMRRGGY